jgi:exonuclease III
MKLISWNVNGIRACVQKGFLDFFKEADADIFCIQETKMQAGSSTSNCRDITSTGIMLCGRDIPELRYSRRKSRSA